MMKKYLLIPVAVIAAGLVLLVAGAGENSSGKVFRSTKAAAAAVGNDDLQLEVLQVRFCRNARHHGNHGCVQEIVGRVVSTGKNAGAFRVGECVGFSGWANPCGECSDCRSDRPEACRYAGWACDAGCDRHPDGCLSRIVISRHHVVALSNEEAREPFAHLCGRVEHCPQLFCHDPADGVRSRGYGHGHCGGGHGRRCR